MKLIFLDIDGVLNRHEYNPVSQSNGVEPACVAHLNKVLVVHKPKIVVSSAWRYMVGQGAMTLRGFSYLLRTHGVAVEDLLGITPLDETCCHCGATIECSKRCDSCDRTSWRGDQISHFLRELPEQPEAYVVIDDIDLGITQAGHPFVETDPGVGLTEELANKVIEVLATKGCGKSDGKP